LPFAEANMKLSKLQLTNFRGFQSLELDLHPRVTLLGGVNGAGKSSILDALAILLSQLVSSDSFFLKGQPPSVLIAYSKKENVSFETLPKKEKDALRLSLLKEQGFLCGYCMCRIDDQPLTTGIEHWHSQAKYPEEALNYKNLHAVCSGNSGQPIAMLHCDKSKAGQSDPKAKPDLHFQPSDGFHPIERMIRYSVDGLIDSDDSIMREDLKMLNLNVAKLKNLRSVVIFTVAETLNSRIGTRTRSQIEKYLQHWNQRSNEQLPEFYGVAVYFLKKKLAKF